jgi:hypothetical protein
MLPRPAALLFHLGLSLVFTWATSAQTVTYTLDLDDAGAGSFSLYAEASAADNAGLALYGVPLTGDVLTLDHRSLAGLGINGLGTADDAGFTEFRSPDGATSVTGGQRLVPNATPFLYLGIGQQAGTATADTTNGPLVTFIATDVTTDQTYDSIFRIATGAYDTSGEAPAFDTNSPDLLANVFVAGSAGKVVAAAVATRVIPEPSTALLLIPGLLAVRRRVARY